MAYHELIKNLNHVRDYMRSFFVYGFQTRSEFEKKSPRSYDNERRRIESWLGEYMAFRREPGGKSLFLTVDSRTVKQNPLYQAFRAKSFTDRDITLHFYILDILKTGGEMPAGQLLDEISAGVSELTEAWDAEESTLRNKLREYEKIGLLESRKTGREVYYRLAVDQVDLDSWQEAAAWFSEVDPMGVIGAYTMDRYPRKTDCFRFKHHYMLHGLDMQILYELLSAMEEKRRVILEIRNLKDGKLRQHQVYPLRIYVSTQNGRQHLLAYQFRHRRLVFFRLDAIHGVTAGEVEEHDQEFQERVGRFAHHVWGVSTGDGKKRGLEHLEMRIHVEEGEEFIRNRLMREKRSGVVEALDEETLSFSIDVYDAEEMLPWLRTFIGRIEALECSNPRVTQQFWRDVEAMKALYGGGGNGVS